MGGEVKPNVVRIVLHGWPTGKTSHPFLTPQFKTTLSSDEYAQKVLSFLDLRKFYGHFYKHMYSASSYTDGNREAGECRQ